MPAKSAKQERFMQAVANNPKFAKQAGVPQSVGKEFTKSKGGQMKDQMKKVATKAVKGHEARMHGAKKMAKGGGVEIKGKTKGKMITMAAGGMAKKSSCK
jgi:hypothetical protein